MIKLNKLYIDPELQFPLTMGLMAAVMAQGVLFCWGTYEIMSVAGHWSRQDQIMAFFKFVLLAGVVAALTLVLINFLLGIYLSNKIAEPLEKIHKAMHEISQGNLEVIVVPEHGELLHSHTAQFNEMAERLRHLIYRDYQYTREVNEAMTRCEHWLHDRQGLSAEDKKDLQKIISEGKSKLSIINSFFIKGLEAKS